MLNTFESLIYPLTFDNFCNEYYLKKAVKIKGGIDTSRIDFNWNSLNNLLNTKKVPFTKIKLFFKGNPLPDANDQYSIQRHCLNGGELIILDIDHHDLNIREFCDSLADQIKSQINSRLFVSSQENSHGNFLSQFYNSFVIQLKGKKNWKICFPANQSQQNNFNSEPELYFESQLQPMEILYIPAEHYYKEENIEPSLSLILTLIQPTAIDFLSWQIKNELRDDELFFKAFPLEFKEGGSDDNWISASWQKRITDLLVSFKDKLADEELIERYYDFLVKTQQGSVRYPFPYPFIAEPVKDLRTIQITRPENQDNVIKVNNLEKSIEIFFWKQKLTFPEKYRKLAEYVFTQNVFTGNDLLELTGPLSEDEITRWVNDLIKRGILQFQLRT